MLGAALKRDIPWKHGRKIDGPDATQISSIIGNEY